MDANQGPYQDASADELERIRSEVERLAWDLADDRISDAEAKRLQQLLQQHAAARDVYLSCMQLHADLQQMFKAEQAANRKCPDGPQFPSSPILRNLGFSSTGEDSTLPNADGEGR